MTREGLADRIVTCSDAVVAFSVVDAFAFVVDLGARDIRCSIADILVFCASVFSGILAATRGTTCLPAAP